MIGEWIIEHGGADCPEDRGTGRAGNTGSVAYQQELKASNDTTLHSLSDAERARDQALGQAREAGE
ncbi:hypothetical protein ACFW9I_31850 [[Kitasatospora] papulosa]|uniref:hypothetical protein n=1 Tax=[Kitasatospora] papulosa TaxID=1464011 RepID=UPI0036786BD0